MGKERELCQGQGMTKCVREERLCDAAALTLPLLAPRSPPLLSEAQT